MGKGFLSFLKSYGNDGALVWGGYFKDVPADKLAVGVKVEKEHKDLYDKLKKRLAAQGVEMPITEQEFYETIAKAHFKEDDDYYDLLLKYVEKKMSEGGSIKGSKKHLNDLGDISYETFKDIQKRAPNVSFDEMNRAGAYLLLRQKPVTLEEARAQTMNIAARSSNANAEYEIRRHLMIYHPNSTQEELEKDCGEIQLILSKGDKVNTNREIARYLERKKGILEKDSKIIEEDYSVYLSQEKILHIWNFWRGDFDGVTDECFDSNGKLKSEWLSDRESAEKVLEEESKRIANKGRIYVSKQEMRNGGEAGATPKYKMRDKVKLREPYNYFDENGNTITVTTDDIGTIKYRDDNGREQEFSEWMKEVGEQNKIHGQIGYFVKFKKLPNYIWREESTIMPADDREILYKKVINLIKYEIEVTIKNIPTIRDWDTLETLHDVPYIHISGRKWNGYFRNYSSSATIAKIEESFPKNKTLLRLASIYREYNMNDFYAGTVRQNEALKNWYTPENKFDFDKRDEYLKSIGLYEDKGYRYGTDWLYKPVPASIVEELKSLSEQLSKEFWTPRV